MRYARLYRIRNLKKSSQFWASRLRARKSLLNPTFLLRSSCSCRMPSGGGCGSLAGARGRRSGVTEFGSAGEDTLFLMDKEFSREDTCSDGIELLDFLVKNSRGIVHIANAFVHCKGSRTAATGLRNRQKDYRLTASASCLNSRTVELSVDDRFARAIRTVVTHKFNGANRTCDFGDSIQKIRLEHVATRSHRRSPFRISNRRCYSRNSDEEASLNMVAALRIFEIQQRYALNAAPFRRTVFIHTGSSVPSRKVSVKRPN